ncbi:MAG: hypothetical protein ACOC0N_04975 [Chroococcales cyanobacterium]
MTLFSQPEENQQPLMLQQASYQTLGILDHAIQRFLKQLNSGELKALGEPPQLRAELRRVEKQGKTQVRAVIVIQCEGIAHRSALLCLKSRLSQAAKAVGIASIGLAVQGQPDVGFFCDY